MFRILLPILGAFLAIPQASLAGHYLTAYRDASGLDVTFEISEDRLATLPLWCPDCGPLPLSISKALAKARSAALARRPNIQSVRLWRFELAPMLDPSIEKQPWFYTFYFYAVSGGKIIHTGNVPEVILMDGTVVDPVPARH